jgi:hypothetical protein
MNLQRFNELMKATDGQLGQSVSEWKCFLEFADAYFKTRDVMSPIVVEIGVMNNCQKPFYVELLNAEHIGIDMAGQPDIVGDSKHKLTLEQLQRRLGGRPIDLLFIDGDHAYAGVKSDYEMYGPLTKHIIALHDIGGGIIGTHGLDDVGRLWKEIAKTDVDNLLLTIQQYNSLMTGITSGYQMGIGLVIKEPA